MLREKERHMLATIDTTPAPSQPVTVADVIGYTIVDAPTPLSLGRLLVAATTRGVCAVRLGRSDAVLEAELAREHPSAELRRDGAPLAPWVNTLLRHLAGEATRFDLPLDVEATAFQRRVWQALRAIPYGETRSYGAVADAIGHPGAARAVARACAANPVALVIPCHRVVRSDGDPGGYRWGVARKRLLLEQERSAAQLAERRMLRALIDAITEGTPPPVATATGPLRAGEVLAGRYEIDRVLGAGGMGVVYAARDLELDEIVALKVLRAPSGSEDAAALDRFRHELRIARRISYPHVVRTHDIGEAAGRRFITMEYVDGWSLAQLLERRGTLPLEATVVIGKQLCRALDVVHGQGVIHRDLKPQNVLITRGGDVKLTDFGIAELDRPRTPAAGADAPRGTLAYMAPEQLLGERVDARADLYATAAVLCECLTGSPPYPAITPESLLAAVLVGGPPLVAEPLGDLLRSALSADGADRPATAAAFHDALADVEWSATEPRLG
jgi:O-6-methylguanine DNA methyltransferase